MTVFLGIVEVVVMSKKGLFHNEGEISDKVKSHKARGYEIQYYRSSNCQDTSKKFYDYAKNYWDFAKLLNGTVCRGFSSDGTF